MKPNNVVLNLTLTLTIAGAALTASSVRADPALAEERAHQVAVKFRDRDFFVTPVDSGLLTRGEMIRIQIPVTRGLDYVVMCSGDEAARDIDLYVYSEVDTLILDDRRPLSDAVVQFRAQYTGSVYAYIFMARTDPTLGLPSWAAFVGRRGSVVAPAKGSPSMSSQSSGGQPGSGNSAENADAVTSK